MLIIPPGVLLTVQVRDKGRLFNTTLPVEILQVGCVIVPTIGAVGIAGCALITTSTVGNETHPEELVTVNV